MATDPVARLEAIRHQAPPVRLVIQTTGQLFSLPATGEIRSFPEWMDADFKGVIESGGSFFVAASAAALETRVLVLGSTRSLVFSRLFSSLGPAAIYVGIVMAILAFIYNPETRDGITIVLARKRPAPE